jgi:excisionase family DNA binding protein
MTVPEFAKRVGIPRSLAYRLIKTGEIPAVRLGEKRLTYERWLRNASTMVGSGKTKAPGQRPGKGSLNKKTNSAHWPSERIKHEYK